MAELTIVYRLRFAVALAAALAVLLAFHSPDAWSASRGEYIVQMEQGVDPETGMRLVERMGGTVTSQALSVVNGFGAALSAAQAAELETTFGVHAVSPNGAVSTSDDDDEDDDDREDGDDRDDRDDRGESGAPEGLSEAEELDLNGGEEEEAALEESSSTAGASAAACAPADATTRRYRSYRGRGDREPSVLSALRRLRRPFLRAARIDRAWTRATGRGVGVAVIDTGIAGDHPDFQLPNGRGSRVVASVVTNPCATDATDHFGHGTHVAGLIGANSLNRATGKREIRGRYMGAAPRAHLVSVKVSDDDGDTTVLDVIYGIQFAVEYQELLGIRVINLSLSSTVPESYLTDPLDAAAEAAWFSGLVVVAAAGNEGTRADAVSYAPGNDPFIITAGGLDDRATWSERDDVLAAWSSRGLTQDGVQKPEMLASGAGMVSTLAPGSDFADMCPTCVVEGEYFRASGTSMSSAVVSGVAALILEKRPHWTPDQVKGAMLRTLRQVPGVGAAVNAYDALEGSGVANAGLARNTLLDPVTRLIDWNRASFRRASFRDASGTPYQASWSRASFRCDCGLTPSGAVEPSRASFRRASFRRTVDLDR